MVEADFTYQCWNKAKYATLSSEDGTLWEKPTVFNNRYRISLGGYWIPNYRGNYAQRITLRAGAWFNHDYLNVNGNNIKDFGVGIGFGLPTSSSKTVINIGFEYRSRFSKPTDLIKEDYINITLGINFNETWFWKNKIR